MPHAEDARFDSLKALIGAWETTITQLNPDGSDGPVSQASDTYAWSANGMFVEHHVDAAMDGVRLRSLEVIALDPTGQGYVTRSYDPDGTFSDFLAERDGPHWTIIGHVQRFIGSFSPDGATLSGQWEQRTGDHWLPLMSVVLRKTDG